MESSFMCCAKVIVQIALLEMTPDAVFACGQARSEKATGPLAMSVESVAGHPILPLRTSVKWQGQEYDIDSAIDVLMNVVRDPKNTRQDRELALIHLTMAGTHLKDRPCLRELETLYDKAGELEKQMILACFLGSRDPRAIPVFVRTLDREQNMKLRLSAASGLAGWNVRRGVAELVELLESKEKLPQPARMPYVRDNASESFRNANARKGWGFPGEEIRKSIESQVLGFDREEFKKRWESGDEETRKSLETRVQIPREEFLALYIAEIKKWWAENEQRFPNWKLGDPLPEIDAVKKSEPLKSEPE